MTQLSVQIPEEIVRQLQQYAQAHQTTVDEVIRETLMHGLDMTLHNSINPDEILPSADSSEETLLLHDLIGRVSQRDTRDWSQMISDMHG